MAIRYNPKYNAEIRRIVHNFNQNVKRANEAGYAKTKLPNTVKSVIERDAQCDRENK